MESNQKTIRIVENRNRYYSLKLKTKKIENKLENRKKLSHLPGGGRAKCTSITAKRSRKQLMSRLWLVRLRALSWTVFSRLCNTFATRISLIALLSYSVINFLIWYFCNFRKIIFNWLDVIVPTFDTKVTEYLCSGWVFFSSDKFRLFN